MNLRASRSVDAKDDEHWEVDPSRLEEERVHLHLGSGLPIAKANGPSLELSSTELLVQCFHLVLLVAQTPV